MLFPNFFCWVGWNLVGGRYVGKPQSWWGLFQFSENWFQRCFRAKSWVKVFEGNRWKTNHHPLTKGLLVLGWKHLQISTGFFIAGKMWCWGKPVVFFLGGGFEDVLILPLLGAGIWSNLTNVFQLCWNHQVDGFFIHWSNSRILWGCSPPPSDL